MGAGWHDVQDAAVLTARGSLSRTRRRKSLVYWPAVTRLPALVLVLSVAACAPPAAAPTASPTVPAPSTPSAASPTPTTSPSPAAGAIPKIPDPIAVQLAVKGSALLILDITTAVCTPRPSCVASLSKVSALLKK